MRSIRPSSVSANGMVASPHHLASSAGLRVLEDGGSAMDAAIATNAMLTVLYPDQTAIGGDCFFLAFAASSGETVAFNGSGAAAQDASASQLRDQGYTTMPAKGGLTVTVPGTIDAWVQGHERFGTLELERLLRPAAILARDGFPVSPRLATVFQRQQEMIAEWPALQSLMFGEGVSPRAGSLLRCPDLATTLGEIGKRGRDAFYMGATAQAIADAVQASGGWLTTEDLEGHEGEWTEPVAAGFEGTTILTTPPNSQGVTVQIALGLAARDLNDRPWGSARQVHSLVEASRRAYGVRDQHLGDPRFIDIDTVAFLDEAFLDGLWADFDADAASRGYDSRAGDTVYLCAIDRDGNAVSMIQSLFGAFGSSVVAGSTGILLQNRGSYFSLVDGHPNELQGGKRTLHTLMPSMMFDERGLLGPIGTQGGDAQAQIQLQLITNLLLHDMEPQQAIDAPRWISSASREGSGSAVALEDGFPDGAVQGLAARGHAITLIEGWNGNAGHAQMILVDQQSGTLKGAADPRADGAALGY
jgi:gamma-glutamyltranspeptidase/glutathione hydrolase